MDLGRFNVTVDNANYVSLRGFIGKGMDDGATLMSDRDADVPPVETYLGARIRQYMDGNGGAIKKLRSEINPSGGMYRWFWYLSKK